MANVRALCEAAKNGNVQEVRRLIEEQGLNPNTLHPKSGTCAIDFAAQLGHLHIIEYLLSKGASLNHSEVGAPENLLYWMCLCPSKEKRQKMLTWLLAHGHYRDFKDDVNDQHIKAALGQVPESQGDIGTPAANGFFPCHYAALAGENPEPWYTEYLESDECLQKTGGLNVAWLLFTGMHLRLLVGRSKQYDDQGRMRLAEHFRHHIVNLNATPSVGDYAEKGTTLAAFLLQEDQINLLNNYLMDHPDTKLDLAAIVTYGGKQKPETVARVLLMHAKYHLFRQAIETLSEEEIAELANKARKLELEPKYSFADSIYECCQLVLMNRRFIELNILLLQYQAENKALTEFLKEELNYIFDKLFSIPERKFSPITHSVTDVCMRLTENHYEAQTIIGCILMEALKNPDLHVLLFEILKDKISESLAKELTWNASLTLESQLHLFMVKCFNKNKSDKESQDLSFMQIAAIYAERDELKERIKKLEAQVAQPLASQLRLFPPAREESAEKGAEPKPLSPPNNSA